MNEIINLSKKENKKRLERINTKNKRIESIRDYLRKTLFKPYNVNDVLLITKQEFERILEDLKYWDI